MIQQKGSEHAAPVHMFLRFFGLGVLAFEMSEGLVQQPSRMRMMFIDTTWVTSGLPTIANWVCSRSQERRVALGFARA